MKNIHVRFFCFFVLLSVSFAALTAQNAQSIQQEKSPEYTPLSFNEIPGVYSIYRDYRKTNEVYIGFCYLGGNELAVRVYDATAKVEVLVAQTFFIKDKTSIDAGNLQILRGSFTDGSLAQTLVSEGWSWINTWYESLSKIQESASIEMKTDNGFVFAVWAPLFNMLQTGVAKDGSGGVRLITAGFADSPEDPAFFAWKGMPEIKKGPTGKIPVGKETPVVIESLSFTLDSNWKQSSDSQYNYAGKTGSDAFFDISTYDISSFGGSSSFDLLYLLVLGSGGMLIPEDLSISATEENVLSLKYKFYDYERKMVLSVHRLFVPREGTLVSVVSLGAIESVYNENQKYFESLIFEKK